jgi:hypothetical protein
VETSRPSRAQKHKAMIVKTADGRRTSVSISDTDVADYVAVCYGCPKLFRRHLNAAALETVVRPGRSRSKLVRANLDRRMAFIREMHG